MRSELAAIDPARRCDRLAEVSALFHTAGVVHLRGRGALAFHLDVGSNAVVRRAFALLRALRVTSEVRTYQRRAFAGETRYQLHVADDAHTLEVLSEAGVLDSDHRPLESPPGRVVARECCRGAYLRGAFLGAGSLSGPRSPHLEIRAPSHRGAAFVRSVASAAGIRLRTADRGGHSVAYAKARDAIEGLLAAAGAVDAVLDMEEQALVAELRADANRLANADHANLVRQTLAAERQLAAAELLRRRELLGGLPDSVREAAMLRLRHPTQSLSELARLAEPPTTKASMARRLTRVVDAAGSA